MASEQVNSDRPLELYKLYVERHFKEGDWGWSRFKIHLALSTGVVVLSGVLITEHIDSLFTRSGAVTWFLCTILFFAGRYLAWAWRRVAADTQRWQLLIDKEIAELEPELLPDDKRGLYTEIVEEYRRTANDGCDCTEVSTRVAGFFHLGFRIAFPLSLILFVIACLDILGR